MVLYLPVSVASKLLKIIKRGFYCHCCAPHVTWFHVCTVASYCISGSWFSVHLFSCVCCPAPFPMLTQPPEGWTLREQSIISVALLLARLLATLMRLSRETLLFECCVFTLSTGSSPPHTKWSYISLIMAFGLICLFSYFDSTNVFNWCWYDIRTITHVNAMSVHFHVSMGTTSHVFFLWK